MTILTSLDFNRILIDVRRSYRLLYVFQKRILDLMKYIGDSYGFQSPEGHAKYSEPIKIYKSGVVNLWSWDWLAMYFYEFHFGLKEFPERDLRFSILLMSDSGLFESSSPNKTDLNSYEAPETSKSYLIFVAGLNAWEMPEIDIEGETTKALMPLDSILNGHVRYINDGVIITKAYQISLFINEEQTIKQLQDFQTLCSLHAVPELRLMSGKPNN